MFLTVHDNHCFTFYWIIKQATQNNCQDPKHQGQWNNHNETEEKPDVINRKRQAVCRVHNLQVAETKSWQYTALSTAGHKRDGGKQEASDSVAVKKLFFWPHLSCSFQKKQNKNKTKTSEIDHWEL